MITAVMRISDGLLADVQVWEGVVSPIKANWREIIINYQAGNYPNGEETPSPVDTAQYNKALDYRELRKQQAVTQFGGALDDWVLVDIDNGLTATIDPMSRPYVDVMDGYTVTEITESTPPDLTADKTSIPVVTDPNNPTAGETITVTCDVGDAGYTGIVKWRMDTPDGSVITGSDNAVAGVDTWQISTTQEGVHWVTAETDTHGIARISFIGE